MTMMRVSERRSGRSERGAILLQVAVGMVVLTAIAMFVIDYGIMWVGRRAAQNAADAGALAGAVALALDNDTRTATGPAKTAAYQFATLNTVVGASPSVRNPAAGDSTDVMFYTDNPAKFPDSCKDNNCIRVDVYRNEERNNALPVYFGALLGVTRTGVKATATAQAAIGDTTDCLKPWAVVDKWDEYWILPNTPTTPAATPWSSGLPSGTPSTFDKYLDHGGGAGSLDPSITTPDVYTPPTTTSTGTGFYPYNTDGTPSPWYGTEIALKVGTTNDYDYTSGWFLALALADSSGGKDYKNNIKGCIGVDYSIGGDLPVDTEPGDKVGPTRQAVSTDADSLINKDPGASWDDVHKKVVGSAFAVSPRIVPVPLVSPDDVAGALKNGRASVKIMNIMGFFVEGMTADGKGVLGRLVAMPGLKASGAPSIGGQSAFLKVIQLVR